jgi:hypothetical protein
MSSIVFTSTIHSSYKAELERLLFFNQNQQKAREDVPLLVERYGMAHVETCREQLRIRLAASPEPQTLYAMEQTDGAERLVGVMVYLREGDTLSLVIAAVHEDYAGQRSGSQPPLVARMVALLHDVGRRVKGIHSVTLFPGTRRERKVAIA